MTKRLFIFAGYDKGGIIDDYIFHYLRTLSEFGDIIFYMDNDIPESELNKIRAIPNMLSAGANRHKEYDFGSYKRGYNYAKNNGILENYDWVYFCNDSVYGPCRPFEPFLKNLESSDADFTGVHFSKTAMHPAHLQSFFTGMRPDIFLSDWFGEFLNGVRHITDKMDIAYQYEIMQSLLISRRKFKMHSYLKQLRGNIVYYKPAKVLKSNCPFIKKATFVTDKIFEKPKTLCSAQIALDIMPPDMMGMILKHARRDGPAQLDRILGLNKTHHYIRSTIRTFVRMDDLRTRKFYIRVLGIPVFWIKKKVNNEKNMH